MNRRPVLFACIAALLLVAVVDASDARADGWAKDLSHELLSPFCPGRTLSACPSPQAKTLVVWLGMQEAAGRTRDDVEAELVAQYGESILSAPPARGFGIAAYVFPVLAFAAGGFVVWGFLRRQTEAVAPPVDYAMDGPIDPELEAIVDRDLSA